MADNSEVLGESEEEGIIDNLIASRGFEFTMWKPALVCFITLMFLLSNTNVYAWESDMHYGLTKWLAVKAGFTSDDAEIIAAGSESADESNVLKASVVVPMYVCLGNSTEASRHVQRHHFPSDGYVPSSKKDRKIIPGDQDIQNGGNRWVRQEISIKDKNKHRHTNLNRFGQSLHPLADSWSHQGIPDKPPITCTDDLFWSHSKDRGGRFSHDADITHKYVDDTMFAAKTIYHYMIKFLQSHPEYKNKSYKSWNGLKSHVKRFAETKTALEKKKWFDSNHDVPLNSYTTYPCFLRDTSLKDHQKICSQDDSEKGENVNQVERQRFKGNGKLQGATEFFDSFLSTWIVKRNIGGIINETFNIQAVKSALVAGHPEWKTIDTNLWFRTILSMWLVPDHGLVNQLGHGMPFLNKTGFDILAHETIRKFGRTFKSLSEAIHFPGTNRPYQIFLPSPSGNDYRVVILFRFNHTPRDMLIFIASKINERWMITGMSWIVS